MLIADPPAPPRPVAVVPIGEAEGSMALVIAEVLRYHGWVVDLGYSGNLSRRMQRANRLNARAAVLIGDEEVARHVVRLRDLDSGEQSDVPAHLPEDPAVPMDQRLVELRARLQAIGG
jgi:histidyl-tRNA synthetase